MSRVTATAPGPVETEGGFGGAARESWCALSDEAIARALDVAARMCPTWRGRPELVLREAVVLRAVLSVGAESVLEVGCGEGLLAAEMVRRGLEVSVVEPVDVLRMWAYARMRAVAPESWCGVGLLAEQALEVAHPRDVVVAVNVLQQVREPASLVRAMARVARRACVLTVPAGAQGDALNVWRFEKPKDLIEILGLDGPFADADVQKLPADGDRDSESWLVVGRAP
jgi:SAM-dependent methyltransferase